MDLGRYTCLRPTHYIFRNGGGMSECTTGWVLEGASTVEGRYIEQNEQNKKYELSIRIVRTKRSSMKTRARK